MAAETHNVPTALTANAFTRTGYTFTGWNTVAGGTGTSYANGATYPFTASVTLYAQWMSPLATPTTPTASRPPIGRDQLAELLLVEFIGHGHLHQRRHDGFRQR